MIDQAARGGHAQALSAHDRESTTVAKLYVLQQRAEAFFFEEQDAAIASGWSVGDQTSAGDRRIGPDRLVDTRQIFSDGDRAEPDDAPGVRLGEMAPIIIDDIPVGAGFVEIVRKQGLAKILIIERLPCQLPESRFWPRT